MIGQPNSFLCSGGHFYREPLIEKHTKLFGICSRLQETLHDNYKRQYHQIKLGEHSFIACVGGYEVQHSSITGVPTRIEIQALIPNSEEKLFGIMHRYRKDAEALKKEGPYVLHNNGGYKELYPNLYGRFMGLDVFMQSWDEMPLNFPAKEPYFLHVSLVYIHDDYEEMYGH